MLNRIVLLSITQCVLCNPYNKGYMETPLCAKICDLKENKITQFNYYDCMKNDSDDIKELHTYCYNMFDFDYDKCIISCEQYEKTELNTKVSLYLLIIFMIMFAFVCTI